MKILDAGCGKARTDVELAKHGAKVVVLDTSKSAIKQAKINIKHYYASMDTLIGDITRIPVGRACGASLEEAITIRKMYWWESYWMR